MGRVLIKGYKSLVYKKDTLRVPVFGRSSLVGREPSRETMHVTGMTHSKNCPTGYSQLNTFSPYKCSYSWIGNNETKISKKSCSGN
ncbi:Uncharacterized protein HZ326_28078 [Fusarium oxysporum f. sp. albedinis]|nr:Uncharacterized protein HZ326_28078 [Fusarium oxysporum f. sp. albedinis]